MGDAMHLFTPHAGRLNLHPWPSIEAEVMSIRPRSWALTMSSRRIFKHLGFTPYSGQQKVGLTDRLTAAGWMDAHVVEADTGFCVLAMKP
jgi:hypothetical protein